MKILLAALLLMSVSGSLYAQEICHSGVEPQPVIAPQPGGWIFRPARGIDMIFGNVPFPDPPRTEGFVSIQYDPANHPFPGRTCNWRNVDMIRFSILSYADPSGTVDERTDTFELPFRTDQAQSYSLDLNDRWIKKVDLYAHNAAGWSGNSNSNYGLPQWTGRRASSQSASAKSEGLEWRLCVVPN